MLIFEYGAVREVPTPEPQQRVSYCLGRRAAAVFLGRRPGYFFRAAGGCFVAHLPALVPYRPSREKHRNGERPGRPQFYTRYPSFGSDAPES